MPENKSNGGLKIGVYVCDCGINIASKVNVAEVVEFAKNLPDVTVAKEYKFMCSDPGQDLIKQDIKDGKINRVVVASCSPLMHENTFRRATSEGGLNQYYFQMANIREHVSWVTADKAAATEKAKALVAAAVRRVAIHQPLERTRVPVNSTVLVVGGGIAGIHAALTLADAGKKVYLVEREPTIGGHMAQFDKTFPTLDCAACILTPKMSAVRSHPNITLWTYSEIAEVSGFVGNFKVKVKRKPRYVIEELCVGCNLCVEACVFKKPAFPNAFDEGLGKRKPIYMPFPQATPSVVLIDPNTCSELKTGKCKKLCASVCERNAIDFTQKEEFKEIDVGAIILATGYKAFDGKRIPRYGYGKYPNVYSSLEVERLVNASGPTGGELVLKNGQKPKSVGIVHCVGSRDENTNKYCSRVCCMYSLKLAHLIKERTGAEVYNFYIDIRTPGKGYEEFYDKLLHEGVHFIRGRVAEINDWAMTPDEQGKLIIRAEDTLVGMVRRIPVDMVVLANGLEPQEDAEEVRRKFNISCSSEGWFLERHPKLAPVSTFTDGIFLAGACQGPKDIPDTVAQAGAASAEAMALIDKGYVELEPNTAYIRDELCSGCHTCIPLCPYNAISFNHEKKIAVLNGALCKGCGTCVAACPSGALQQNLFTDEQIFQEIKGVMSYV
ncbi:MAG: CoB--CoM heterodisulfide reductase iron-sulfur subunit A family protein [candidate division Zixibacteria bacterium]|jgi:heterodisulfide reductase subunit A|nr:CoB--CoM heterodisulfide reductase iron-sulfur subunit A family protein [candidate division Zixibacteria bacterium]